MFPFSFLSGPTGAFGDMMTAPFSQIGGSGPLGWMGGGYNALLKSNVNPFSISSLPRAQQGAMNILQPMLNAIFSGTGR